MKKQQKHVKPQDLEERLIEFASRIIDMSEALPQSATAKHLGSQILRSGTSPLSITEKHMRQNQGMTLSIK